MASRAAMPPDDYAVFQPDYCETPKDMKPNARPFTASATSDNLFACIHRAENLTTLANKASSTFVVLRVGRVLESSSMSEFWACPSGEKHAYMTSYTQFAATRVVGENSFQTHFNELLVVNIPPSANQSGWGIRLDVVQRLVNEKDSPDGDLLVAYAALPLEAFARNMERSLALHFPTPGLGKSEPVAFVTFFRQTRSVSLQFEMSLKPSSRDNASSSLWHRLEFTIDAITWPDRDTSIPEQTLAMVQLSTSALPALADVAQLQPFQDIRSHHDVMRSLPATTNESVYFRVTPSASPSTSFDGPILTWQYPMLFDFPAVPTVCHVLVTLFTATRAGYKCMGQCGQPVVLTMPSSLGTRQSAPDIFITMTEPTALELTLRSSLRWWSGATWPSFRKERVVCTNRPGSTSRKRTPQPWMAAIVRGLNRHPISAVVDTGGIVGVIAAMFQPVDAPTVEKPVQDTLQEQLECLMRELSSKQSFLDKMQKEMDKRTNAIKACGVEIVDLRKTIQRKDQTIQALQVKLNNYELLEQRQQEEIRLCLKGNESNNSKTTFPVLAQQYTKLQHKHNELEASHALLSRKLLEARNFEAELMDVKTQFQKLQDAHVAQAAFVQKANTEVQKLAVYKQTIATQETVIAKLEKLVESKLAETKASHPLGPNVHAEIFRLRLENAYLKEQTKNRMATGRVEDHPSHSTPPLSGARRNTGTTILQPLQSKSETRQATDIKACADQSTMTTNDPNHGDENVLHVKIRVLESQLEVNATNAAQEIAALKARLFEYEMGSVWK
ncbi:hypothetical protein Ae201684P_015032 [Aphanomyces euteiches]|uniref:Uncharacterized protein n=1 Tax=Aphanomyces euteiches TaxID=100861 RepID=A0A6G0XGW9_9STRA|nr:hypothetical protein Ae201684_004733 [Aphanomyces euteiches]KAH9073215.1 hypothetical protein Ae201684P_015032 [Aphanomyces euteiches]KAH9153103.1 hypothetical protein AeRB84_004585 [Aphanomyces euteiches]